jgi:hypothetical protein
MANILPVNVIVAYATFICNARCSVLIFWGSFFFGPVLMSELTMGVFCFEDCPNIGMTALIF